MDRPTVTSVPDPTPQKSAMEVDADPAAGSHLQPVVGEDLVHEEAVDAGKTPGGVDLMTRPHGKRGRRTQGQANRSKSDRIELVCRKTGGYWSVYWTDGENRFEARRRSDSGSIDETDISLPLLFRLKGPQLHFGHQVRQVSCGSYIAIVARDWRRVSASGAAPEPTQWPDVVAHFISTDQSSAAECTFESLMGGVHRIGGCAVRVQLQGTRIEGPRDGIGPLFGVGPVQVQAPAEDWLEVKHIVVRRDDVPKRTTRPRCRLDPPIDQSSIEVQEVLEDMRAAWATVLLYDSHKRLIDSIDFRWMPALERVEVTAGSQLPGLAGHELPTILIGHAPGTVVTCVKPEDGVTVQTTGSTTAFKVTPTALQGPARIHVKHGFRVCEFDVPIDLLIWAVTDLDTQPASWTDRQLPADRACFRPTSKCAIWIQRTCGNGVADVRIGPAWHRARPALRSRAVECIPLREFGDLDEIRDETKQATLSLWISPNLSTPVITIDACISPPLQLQSEDEFDIPTSLLSGPAPATAATRRPSAAPVAPPPMLPTYKIAWDINKFVSHLLSQRERLLELVSALSQLRGRQDSKPRAIIDLWMSNLTNVDADQWKVAWLALCAVENFAPTKPRWLQNAVVPDVARMDMARATRWLREQGFQ